MIKVVESKVQVQLCTASQVAVVKTAAQGFCGAKKFHLAPLHPPTPPSTPIAAEINLYSLTLCTLNHLYDKNKQPLNEPKTKQSNQQTLSAVLLLASVLLPLLVEPSPPPAAAATKLLITAARRLLAMAGRWIASTVRGPQIDLAVTASISGYSPVR